MNIMTIKKPSLFNKLKLAGILLLCYISLPLTSICNAAYQNNASGWCNDADMEDKPLFDNNNNPIMDPSNPTVQLTVRVPKSGVQCCGDGYLNLNAGEECDLGLSRNGLDENNSTTGTSGTPDNVQDYGCSKDCKINKSAGWRCNSNCTEFANIHKEMTDLYREIIEHINNNNGECFDSANIASLKCQAIVSTFDAFKSANKHVGLCNTIKDALVAAGKNYTNIPDFNYPTKNIKIDVNFTNCNKLSCAVQPESTTW